MATSRDRWPLGGLPQPHSPDRELPAVVGVADLRATNAAAILAAVRSADPHPRLSTLAEATKLSRPTVEAIVEELTDRGLIEVAPAVSARGQRSPGRPARRFRFCPHAGFVVGVDVRARSVSVCLADLDGRPVAVERKAVRADLGGPARARAVVAVVRRVIERSGADARRVWAATVGTPGLVDRSNTRIRQADNLKDWAEADIVTVLRDALGCPVAVENDANLAALGEQWRGVGGEADEMVFVLLGERLGAGVITGGACCADTAARPGRSASSASPAAPRHSPASNPWSRTRTRWRTSRRTGGDWPPGSPPCCWPSTRHWSCSAPASSPTPACGPRRNSC